MSLTDTAFSKGTPSVFVIGSPFQALCAYEAIHEFEIKDYEVFVLFEDSDSRTEQLFASLDYFNLIYTKHPFRKHAFLRELLKFWDLFWNNGKQRFQRVFVGDFRSHTYMSLAFKNIKKNGSIIYLDDGNISIDYLKGLYKYTIKEKVIKIFFQAIALLRRIHVDSLYYTIYSDISTKKCVAKNSFHSLIRKNQTAEQQGIFFIGTNPDAYCYAQEISTSQYFELLENQLSDFKRRYSQTSAYYVFHGRDKYKEKTIAILNKYDFIPLQLNEIVEMYFIRNNINPLAVTGFMSSALFTIKKICPVSKIESIMIEGNATYKNICEYYQTNGIEIKVITGMVQNQG